MRKIIPVVAAGATTLALAGTTFGYANLNKSVALSVDGETSQVRTSADTVAALLKSEGIEVDNHDVVAPNLDAKVADGTRVAVKFGREVTFTIDGAEQTIWTTATTVDEALNALAIDLAGASCQRAAAPASDDKAWPSSSARRRRSSSSMPARSARSQPPVRHWPMLLPRPRSLWTMTTS